MKKLLLFAFVLIAATFLSCEDSLSPKTEFEQEYALYSVLDADTTFQTVYISSSYQVPGYDGNANTIDPAVQGATVKLTVNGNKIYNFTAATVPRTDTSRYKTPVKFYSLNAYKPVDGDIVEITATLNNGKVLKSNSLVPPVSYLYYEQSTINYDPSVDDGTGVAGIKFAWRFLSSQFNTSVNYFAPRLELVYYKAGNPVNKFRVKVPLYFLPQGDSYIPNYPNVSTGTTITFYGDSIERALNLISEGDSQKSNYIFDRAEFTLLLVDKNLAAYLASETTFTDEFSVRVDAADFSNIQGGLGMFGAAASKKTSVKISKWYIESFGYKTSY